METAIDQPCSAAAVAGDAELISGTVWVRKGERGVSGDGEATAENK